VSTSSTTHRHHQSRKSFRTQGKGKAEEGCLSIPDIYGDVERPADGSGARDSTSRGGNSRSTRRALRCAASSTRIDHLHGKLFIDYLSVLNGAQP
jgi:peptide deformylase